MAKLTIDWGAVDEYAEWLIRVLGQDLSVLSGSGLPLRYEARSSLTLEHFDGSSKRSWGPLAWSTEYDNADLLRQGERGSLESDLVSLDAWRRKPLQSRHPLVIVGPFGSGKSALLAWLAVKMGLELREAIKSGTANSALVPFPVRLRDIRRWDRTNKGDERFLPFMCESQYALDPNSRRGPLNHALIERLLECQQLVPLFDGLDELPDSERAQQTSRRKVLRAISTTCCRSYAITSRPCYEVDCLVDDAETIALRPLVEADVSRALENRLASSPGAIRIAKDTLARCGAHTASLLTRPLFLAAWCRLIPQDGSKPPSGIDGLMTEVVLHCFDGRIPAGASPSEDVDETLTELGEVLAVFVDHGMDSCLDESTFFRSCSSDLGSQPELARKQIALAVTAGLLSPVGQRSWAVQRMPVVDFLVGRFLARSVRRDGSRPHALVNYFRQWAGKPAQQVVLDFAFSILWEGDNADRRWAYELAAWSIAAGASADDELCRTENAGSDVVHPLAVAALRWCTLDPNRKETEKLRLAAIKATSASLVTAHSFGVAGPLAVAGVSLDRKDALELCSVLVEEHGQIGRWSSWSWGFGIAKRIKECDTASLVSTLVELGERGRQDMWLDLVRWTAGSVSENDAVPLLEAAIQKDSEGILWRMVVIGAATRVAPKVAAEMVEECIRRATTVAEEQYGFYAACFHLACRIPQKEAAAIVRRWMAQHDRDASQRARALLRSAIDGGAYRVDPSESLDLLSELVERGFGRSAIRGAARNLPSVVADDLLEEYCDRRDPLKWLNHGPVIEGAVQAISTVPATRLVLTLMEDLYLRDIYLTKPDFRLLLLAGRRVAAADALMIIKELIRIVGLVQQDTISCWLDTLTGPICVLQRSESEAALAELIKLRRTLINKVDRFNPKPLEQIGSLLAQCGERVPADRALSTCSWLIAEGAVDAAMQIAAGRDGVAIVGRVDASSTKVVDLSGLPAQSFVACSKEKMVLSTRVASEAIRTVATLDAGYVVDGAYADVNQEVGRIITGGVRAKDIHYSFVFRRGSAKTWTIAFNGETHTIGGTQKGLEYIARLIEQPNKRLSPLDLTLTGRASVLRAQAERDRPVELIDAEGVKDIRRRLSELQSSLQSGEDAAAEEESRQLQKVLRQASRPGRRRASIQSTAIKKAATNVQNAIARAISHLNANGLEELAIHLKECGCAKMDDYHFVYRNSSPPTWDVSWLEPVPKG